MKYSTFFSKLSLLLTLGGASSTLMAQELQVCGEDYTVAMGNVNQEVRLLKIATTGADFRRMRMAFNALDGHLKTCLSSDLTDELDEKDAEIDRYSSALPVGKLTEESLAAIGMVCGYECHYTMAQYALFQAYDYDLLSNKADNVKNSAARKAEWFGLGVNILDRGIALLATQQKGSDDPTTQDSTQDAGAVNSFDAYSRNLARLNKLYLKLYLAVGDAFYKSATELTLKKTNHMLTKALDEPVSEEDEASDQNLSKALNYYNDARWLLLGAMTDIPDTMRDEAAQFSQIQYELNRRVSSIQSGFLFLNIDPESSTQVPLEKLLKTLSGKIAELERVENEIISRFMSSKNDDQAQTMRDNDMKRLVESKTIAVSGHKIASYEHAANQVQQELQESNYEFSNQKENLSHQMSLARLKFDFKKAELKLQHDLSEINQRQQLQILAFKKNGLLEERSELRWRINYEITNLNLQAQLDSLKQQLYEYRRQQIQSQSQINILQGEKDIIANQDLLLGSKDGELLQTLTDLKERKTTIYDAQVESLKFQICAAEAQLIFLAGPGSFAPSPDVSCDEFTTGVTKLDNQAEICKLREDEGLAQADLLEIIASCTDSSVTGQDCEWGDSDAMQMAKAMYEKNKASYDNQIKELEFSAQLMRDQLGEIDDAFDKYSDETKLIKAGIAGLSTASQAAGMMARIVCGGTAACDNSAQMPYFKATTLLTAGIGYAQIEMDNRSTSLSRNNSKASVRAEIQRLEKLISTEKEDLIKRGVMDAQRDQLYFEITGKAHQTWSEKKIQDIRNRVTTVSCDGEKAEIETAIATNRLGRDKLLSDLKFLKESNDLIDGEEFRVNKQLEANEILRSQNKIKQDQLEEQIKTHQTDIDLAATLMAGITGCDKSSHQSVDGADLPETFADDLTYCDGGRFSRVEQVKGSVADLAEESNLKTAAIKEINEQLLNEEIALLDAQADYIRQNFQENVKTETDVLEEKITGLMDLSNEQFDMTTGVMAQLTNLRSKIESERDAIFDTLRVPESDEQQRIFLATQEDISDIVRGVPEYIEVKRQLIADANYILNKVRSRYNRLGTLIGRQPMETLYATNSQILKGVYNRYEIEEIDSSVQQVSIDETAITIPGNSALARELALNGEAEFNIGYLEEGKTMADHGYYRVWSEVLDQQDTRLLDVRLTAESVCGATESGSGDNLPNITIIHKGNGWVFKRLSKDSEAIGADLVVSNRQAVEFDFWDLSTFQKSKFEDWKGSYGSDAFNLQQFETNFATQKMRPLMGLPVMGTYKLVYEASKVCPINGTSFKVHLAFTKYNKELKAK